MYLLEIALFILKIIMDIKCIVRDFLELTSILNNNKNRQIEEKNIGVLIVTIGSLFKQNSLNI